MKSYSKYILLGIIVIASILRLHHLNEIPPGVNRDEASIGFTAYSLMNTGKDEYGRKLPLSFESFGDWKLPLYIYTTIPFVKIFGLTEIAVRLPSALAGILSVGALYFLTYILFRSEIIGLLAAFSLSIMPWHIHISRVESEAIVAVLLTLIGSIYFLSSLRKQSLLIFIFSILMFIATYYTYHGNHVFTSLLLMGITYIYWREIIKIRRWWIAYGTGLFFLIIILNATLSADKTKISGIGIFGDPTTVYTKIELPRLVSKNPNSLLTRLIYNRITYASITILHNYLKSYGPEFLFINGGKNSAHNIQGFGNLHPIEALPLFFGIIWLGRKFKKKEVKFILWWITIGGITAAITKDAPHSNRMLAVVPAFAIATGAGIQLLIRATPVYWRTAVVAIFVVGYGISFSYYLHQYYRIFPYAESYHWGYAYKKLTTLLFSPEYADKYIVMSHPEISPYMYLLFYSGYNPETYQQEAKRYPMSRDGFTDVRSFGRFSFRPIIWDEDIRKPNTVIVAKREDIPDSYMSKTHRVILLRDNTPYWYVFDVH